MQVSGVEMETVATTARSVYCVEEDVTVRVLVAMAEQMEETQGAGSPAKGAEGLMVNDDEGMGGAEIEEGTPPLARETDRGPESVGREPEDRRGVEREASDRGLEDLESLIRLGCENADPPERGGSEDAGALHVIEVVVYGMVEPA